METEFVAVKICGCYNVIYYKVRRDCHAVWVVCLLFTCFTYYRLRCAMLPSDFVLLRIHYRLPVRDVPFFVRQLQLNNIFVQYLFDANLARSVNPQCDIAILCARRAGSRGEHQKECFSRANSSIVLLLCGRRHGRALHNNAAGSPSAIAFRASSRRIDSSRQSRADLKLQLADRDSS